MSEVKVYKVFLYPEAGQMPKADVVLKSDYDHLEAENKLLKAKLNKAIEQRNVALSRTTLGHVRIFPVDEAEQARLKWDKELDEVGK